MYPQGSISIESAQAIVTKEVKPAPPVIPVPCISWPLGRGLVLYPIMI